MQVEKCKIIAPKANKGNNEGGQGQGQAANAPGKVVGYNVAYVGNVAYEVSGLGAWDGRTLHLQLITVTMSNIWGRGN